MRSQEGLTAAPVVVATAAFVLAAAPAASADEGGADVTEVVVTQEAGKVVHWVLPGKRRLDPALFGVPGEEPRRTGQEQLEAARRAAGAGRASSGLPDLLEELPFLVGAPADLREETGDGVWRTSVPTRFSDRARRLPLVPGRDDRLRVRFLDRTGSDGAGDPTETPDSAELECRFHDPDGNAYELRLRSVIAPPIPDWETEGGVLLDGHLHGDAGTGSPLMPRVYTHGALWGVADVVIAPSGGGEERTERGHLVHIMTTEVVRDDEYRLVTGDRLPLPPDERIVAGQPHHTHVIVLPVVLDPVRGLVHRELESAYALEDGRRQPFIHVVFEQDELVRWPFADGGGRPQAGSSEGVADGGDDEDVKTVHVEGKEYAFVPDHFTVKTGQSVEVVFENSGTITHDFHILELDLHSDPIQPGEQVRYTFEAPEEAGTLHFECKVRGHPMAGMKGTITVED